MRRALPVNFLLILLLFMLTGCPHIGGYRPVSSWEKQALDSADLTVFPDDVRGDLSNKHDTVLAWPGIIVSSEFVDQPGGVEVQFVLEHHYYDWLEDNSIQREKIFLSPRGEGQFRTSWYIKKDSNIEARKKAAGVGNLVIVYGTPEHVNADGSISLRSTYIRGIEKQWYRTDVLDYGRPGQPVKLIKAPHQ